MSQTLCAPQLTSPRRPIGLALLLLFAAAALALPACANDAGSGASGGADLADVGGGTSDVTVAFDVPDLSSTSDATDSDEPEIARCEDDRLEPSSFNRPVAVSGAVAYDDLVICRFDDDWFRLDLDAGERVEVQLDAPYAEGDLDLLLFTTSLDVLASSTTTADREVLAYGASEAETVMLRIYGVDGDAGGYSVSFDFSTFGDDCSADVEEPNDTAETAADFGTSIDFEGRICRDDVDWFRVDLAAGDSLAARLDFEHDLGDLDMRLFRSDALSEPIAESRGETDVEHVEAGPFEEPVTLMLEIFGYRGALNDYRLQLRVLPPPDTALAVSGVVRYEDRPFTGEGFTGELVERPARGHRVELVRAFDGAAVATATADAEGTYALEAQVHGGEQYYVRAVATVSLLGLEAEVMDRTDDVLYALAGEPFEATADTELTSDLVAAADEPAGGAFNIMDVVYGAFEFVRTYTDESGEPLTYRWEPGRAFSCGSCYSGNVISLGGQLEDSDEYDDDIVLHEFGHYFQDNFSADDSPGGSHNGERLNPLLAYGEGMATYFSSMVQNDPEYVDLYIDSLRLRDLETAAEDPEQFYGTVGDTLTGDVSEYLVAAVMWDTIDPASEAEPYDALERDPGDVMTVFMDYMRRRDRPLVGVPGIDLADWLNGMSCAYPDVAEALTTLVVEDRQYPWDPDVDLSCPGKDTDAVPVEVLQQGDQLWLDGLEETAALAVRVDDGQGWGELQALACGPGPCLLPAAARPDRAVVVTGTAGDRPVRTSWLGPLAQRRLLGTYRDGWSELGRVREWPSR